MSSGSVAERFLFVYNPDPSPPHALSTTYPSVVFRSRFSSGTLQNYLRDQVWDKGKNTTWASEGAPGLVSLVARSQNFWCLILGDPKPKPQGILGPQWFWSLYTSSPSFFLLSHIPQKKPQYSLHLSYHSCPTTFKKTRSPQHPTDRG